MRIKLKIDKLRPGNEDNLTNLLQDATLFHIEAILHTNPFEYYQEIKNIGIGNVSNSLYSKIYIELSDWLKHNQTMIEFLTEMNLLAEIETVLAETVSFYVANYFVRVMECFNIRTDNRVIGITRRELDKRTYLIEVITEE